MKVTKAYSCFDIENILNEKNLLDEIFLILNDESIMIYDLAHKDLKKIITDKFTAKGWGTKVQVFYNSSSFIDLILDKTVIHIQFGHRSQSYYDLLKFSTLFHKNKIDSGVLLVPTKKYAFGGRTDVDVFVNHNQEFEKFLNIPLLILEIS